MVPNAKITHRRTFMKKYLFSLFVSVIGVALVLSVGTAAERPDQQKLIEGAKKEGEVIVWTHTWRRGAEKVLEPFYQMYPFLKVKVWDTRTVNVVNKIITEAKAGKYSPDVLLITSRGFPLIRKAGLLKEYDWPNHVRRWPHQPNHKYWINIVGNFYIPTYNSRLIPKNEAPKSWDDLKNPKWKGKTIISSSGSGAPLLFAHMWSKEPGKLNWEKAFDFWSEVVKVTQPKVQRGFGGPTELHAAGEYPIFLLNSIGIALRAMDRGAPVKLVPIREAIVGSSWSLAMPKTVPHPNATKLFLNYLVSAEGVARYATANQTPALDPKVSEKVPINVKLKKLGVDWYPLPEKFMTAENLKKATNWWATTLGVKRKRR